MNHSESDVTAPVAVDPLAAAAAGERHSTAAQLGQRLLRVLAPLRVELLSLHDAAGERLWRSRGPWGEAEERYARDAEDAFALEGHEQHLERALEDGRRALFFCARTSLGERDGMACAIAQPGEPPADMAAIRARVFAAMRRFSMRMPPTATLPAKPPQPAAPAPESAAAASTVAADRPLDYSPATPAALEVSAPLEPSAGAPSATLRLRPYVNLRSKGTTRRYEIADSRRDSVEDDLHRARRLIRLIQRRGARDGSPAPATFTLPLSTQSVSSPQFMTQLAPIIHGACLTEGMMGFALPAASWTRRNAGAGSFVSRCEAVGCFIALEDFNLVHSGYVLLRSPAVRCLKLDPALTRNVREDRFAHATVMAIVQAARVLGLYCVAREVESPAAARWLGAAGIDYSERVSRPAAGVATTRGAKTLQPTP
jgi:EAL domain-containing protein (putative c-di-GMP-specific phosphodiesterase class I)